MKAVFLICIVAMFIIGITEIIEIGKSILAIAFTISIYILFKDEIKNREEF